MRYASKSRDVDSELEDSPPEYHLSFSPDDEAFSNLIKDISVFVVVVDGSGQFVVVSCSYYLLLVGAAPLH